MSIEKRIEKLEKRYGDKEGCTIFTVIYDGDPSPPEGAAEQYLGCNKLCENCARKGKLCVLYWNGEAFSGDGKGATLP